MTIRRPLALNTLNHRRSRLHLMRFDGALFLSLLLLSFTGLVVLYSASGGSLKIIESQCAHLMLAFGIFLVFAQIPPTTWQRSALPIYIASALMLVGVLAIGHIGKGAQRWLTVFGLRLQPAEFMKLAIPLLLASYLHAKPLPIKIKSILIALPIIFIPALLIAKQPDLGTAILIAAAGISILFLAGLDFRLLGLALLSLAAILPFGWHILHDYQKQRVLTFLNPERDPLGTGYHIIQSKIAIGSGGLFGKGFLHGTQSNLHFLPEHTTDFIFAVCGEEFGFVGCLFLLMLFMLILWRALFITLEAQDTFSRLYAGSVTIMFFISFFINISMVVGLLPVVGIPLPLVSYGGSSMVTMMASFGILMSIQSHKKLISN